MLKFDMSSLSREGASNNPFAGLAATTTQDDKPSANVLPSNISKALDSLEVVTLDSNLELLESVRSDLLIGNSYALEQALSSLDVLAGNLANSAKDKLSTSRAFIRKADNALSVNPALLSMLSAEQVASLEAQAETKKQASLKDADKFKAEALELEQASKLCKAIASHVSNVLVSAEHAKAGSGVLMAGKVASGSAYRVKTSRLIDSIAGKLYQYTSQNSTLHGNAKLRRKLVKQYKLASIVTSHIEKVDDSFADVAIAERQAMRQALLDRVASVAVRHSQVVVLPAYEERYAESIQGYRVFDAPVKGCKMTARVQWNASLSGGHTTLDVKHTPKEISLSNEYVTIKAAYAEHDYAEKILAKSDLVCKAEQVSASYKRTLRGSKGAGLSSKGGKLQSLLQTRSGIRVFNGGSTRHPSKHQSDAPFENGYKFLSGTVTTISPTRTEEQQAMIDSVANAATSSESKGNNTSLANEQAVTVSKALMLATFEASPLFSTH